MASFYKYLLKESVKDTLNFNKHVQNALFESVFNKSNNNKDFISNSKLINPDIEMKNYAKYMKKLIGKLGKQFDGDFNVVNELKRKNPKLYNMVYSAFVDLEKHAANSGRRPSQEYSTKHVEEIINRVNQLPDIPQDVLKDFGQFIMSQQKMLTELCPVLSEMNADLIKNAYEKLRANWGIEYDEFYEFIKSLKPHAHGFFDKPIVEFLAILMWYGFVRDNTTPVWNRKILYYATLAFALFSFSYNFKKFFRYCNKDAMLMALHNMHNKSVFKKHGNFFGVLEYFTKSTLKTYLEERKPHDWVMFQIMININNRVKLSLRSLANVYYALFEEGDERQYYSEETFVGINVETVIKSLELNFSSITYISDTELKLVVKECGNNLTEEDVKSIFKLMATEYANEFKLLIGSLLSLMVKEKVIETESDLTKNVVNIKRFIIRIFTGSAARFNSIRARLHGFMDKICYEADELKYDSNMTLDRVLSLKEKAILFFYAFYFIVKATYTSVGSL